ncbi:MAG: hypothetical protein QNJ78_14200 [Gammaproteobacteria bacterium]|nr:hypothetical protein [Gammaproteobacteria bacterium]
MLDHSPCTALRRIHAESRIVDLQALGGKRRRIGARFDSGVGSCGPVQQDDYALLDCQIRSA